MKKRNYKEVLTLARQLERTEQLRLLQELQESVSVNVVPEAPKQIRIDIKNKVCVLTAIGAEDYVDLCGGELSHPY